MANKVYIVADSACDLSKELLEKYQIQTISLHVNFDNGDEYLDGKTIELKEMFRRVEESGNLPKTSAVSPAEFMRFFNDILKEDENGEIIYIGLSSTFSSTIQAAIIAADGIDNNRIHIIDSKNLSTGIGLLLLKACTYRDRGYSAKKIVSKVNSLIPRIKTQFVLKSLEFLKKGGRCKSLTFIISSVLKIRPMIVVREGKMVVGRKVIGNMKKACTDMVKLFNNDIQKIDPEFVFVTHCAGEESIEYLFEPAKSSGIVKNIFITEAGCTIGTHCGPGCIGILYILKDENVTLEYNELEN